jgi:hypothetical protein
VIFDFIKIDARMNAVSQLLLPVQILIRSLFGRYFGEKKAEHFCFCEKRVSYCLSVGSGKADIWNLLL